MSDAIEAILRDPTYAQRLSEVSRQMVCEKFDAKKTAGRLLDCIEKFKMSSCEREASEKLKLIY
jgi:glycosyltransferase involved in cell wall biosynthesis